MAPAAIEIGVRAAPRYVGFVLVVLPEEPVARSRHLVSMVGATGTTVGFVVIALTGAGWPAALALAIASLLLTAAHLVRHRDPVWARLAIVAVVAAPFALIGDWWCVREGGLAYVQEGPFVLVSPLYLPLLFPAAVFQIWYLMDVVRLRLEGEDATGPMRTRTWVIGVAASVVFGGLYVPFYEFLAKWGDLWVYEGQAGAFDGVVPWYVVGAEVFQFCLTPLAVTHIGAKSLPDVFVTGILVGTATVGGWAVCLFLLT